MNAVDDGVVNAINRRLMIALVAAAASMAFVAKLWESVRERDEIVQFDQDATRWLVMRRTDGVVSIMRFVTRLADIEVVSVIVVGVTVALLVRRLPRAAVFIIVASAGTAILVAVMKLAAGRSRPPVGAVVVAAGNSFPSGHAAQSIACYGSLAVVVWGLTSSRTIRTAAVSAAVFFALAIGTSRLVLGVHWVSDVLAGWAVAVGWISVTMVATGLMANVGGVDRVKEA